MATEDELPLRANPEGQASSPLSSGLEERVARLELELAALQRQIAEGQIAGGQIAEGSTQPGTTRQAPAARPADSPARTPPPPRLPVQFDPVPDNQRLVSNAWASTRPIPTPLAAADSRDSFENRLGSQIFNRIAIVLLLIGMAYFLKLAVDRHWITPTGRVIAGLIAGTGLILWSERFRRQGFATFSYSLKAVGSGVLYLSLWAAYHLFHLLPDTVALALMLLVTAWNAYMAWVQDSELLAAYALAGGFATPLLLSTGGNHEVFLFTYLLAIDLAIAVLVRLKTWPRLLLGTFPLTVVFFIGWYSQFYAAGELMTTSVFIALFGAAFASVALRRTVAVDDGQATRLATVLEDILLPLANAAFVSLAFYSVLQDSGHHDLLPWLMIVLAAVYLALMRAPQTRTASAIHLSLAVVFLTIAIPLKASGHWITVSWLVEGLALLWVASRLTPHEAPVESESDAGYAATTLRWLSAASLLLGFCGILTHEIGACLPSAVPFFDADRATAFIGIAIFAVAAWLALRTATAAKTEARAWQSLSSLAFIAIAVVAFLLTLRELLASAPSTLHPPFQSADFAAALTGLVIFAGVIAISLRLARSHPDENFWMGSAAASTIAFNLIALLTGVREIDAVWASSSITAEGELQQALAISAFLMLYGAALLAAGFWKRSSFLRWQALVLLVFTIFKTFLYDMRSLSQGYRVISILGLGALLMAISFAYQKDWLNLREPNAAPDPARPTGPEALK